MRSTMGFLLCKSEIEQAITDVKDWAATHETLHLPMTSLQEVLDFHHQVWTVVSCDATATVVVWHAPR